MSASASDQRMKGQGNHTNGPKEQVSEHEEFDSWRSQAHQGYGVPANDQYISSYYGTALPYQSFDGGAWSNTGTAAAEGVPFLGNYGPAHGPNHESYSMEGMFGSGGTGFANFGQQGFGGAGYSGSEYSTWGRKPTYDEYYQRSGEADVKGVEHAMQGISLDGQKQGGGITNTESSTSTSSQAKKLTWASIASQPAKPQLTNKKKSMVPPPMIVPRTPSLDIGTWETRNGSSALSSASLPPPATVSGPAPSPGLVKPPTGPPPPVRSFAAPPPPRPQIAQRSPLPPMGNLPPTAYPPPPAPMTATAPPTLPPPTMMPPPPAPTSPSSPQLSANPILEELHSKHEYNPKDFDLNAKNARFFVIKSYSEDDIHRSIKYEIWCSTEHGNKRLDGAFREREGKGPVYLFFSVNGSGHFCGMAEMTSPVDMSATLSVWSQDKWRGQFTVKWIYVKDVPNSALRHIRLENNENKPVTNSRDTQEVPPEKGRQVLRILHNYKHATSIFDDFTHYEKRQAEEDQRKTVPPPPTSPLQNELPPYDPRRDRERERDRDIGRPEPRDREREPYRADQREQGRGRGGFDYRERDNRSQRDGYRSGGGGGDYSRDRDSFRGGRGWRPGGGGNRH